jgi:hypothetical protein
VMVVTVMMTVMAVTGVIVVMKQTQGTTPY